MVQGTLTLHGLSCRYLVITDSIISRSLSLVYLPVSNPSLSLPPLVWPYIRRNPSIATPKPGEGGELGISHTLYWCSVLRPQRQFPPSVCGVEYSLLTTLHLLLRLCVAL